MNVSIRVTALPDFGEVAIVVDGTGNTPQDQLYLKSFVDPEETWAAAHEAYCLARAWFKHGHLGVEAEQPRYFDWTDLTTSVRRRSS